MVRDSTTLTCKEVVELVTDLLGDSMDPEERVRLEQHLLVCPPCTLHVGQVRATIGYAALLRTEAPTGQVNRELIERFRNWRQK